MLYLICYTPRSLPKMLVLVPQYSSVGKTTSGEMLNVVVHTPNIQSGYYFREAKHESKRSRKNRRMRPGRSFHLAIDVISRTGNRLGC